MLSAPLHLSVTARILWGWRYYCYLHFVVGEITQLGTKSVLLAQDWALFLRVFYSEGRERGALQGLPERVAICFMVFPVKPKTFSSQFENVVQILLMLLDSELTLRVRNSIYMFSPLQSSEFYTNFIFLSLGKKFLWDHYTLTSAAVLWFGELPALVIPGVVKKKKKYGSQGPTPNQRIQSFWRDSLGLRIF